MFQVSLLQSVSGSSENNSKRSSRRSGSKHESPTAANSTDTGSLSTTLGPRDWTEQAADITDNLLDASKYKSLAVYAEVKLAEALNKASKVQPDAVSEDGDPLPNSLKTAVCFQLLGELAELCGPFSNTLLKLRDQLLPAVYSSYAAAEATMPLRFDQMPWFRVASHLKKDNSVLLTQQETFKRELVQHQAHFTAVEQQLLSFKAAIDAGEAAAAALTATNATLVAARNAAVDEATAAADEVKRLAAEVAQLKEERNEALNQLSNLQDLSAQDKDEWEANLAALKKQILIAQQEKESAVAMAAARLTAAEGQELQQRCAEAESKLEEAEQRLAAMDKSSAVQNLLTPRPADWGPDKELAERCKSTTETVRQMQQQHLEAVTALQRQVSILQALQQPDPAQKPWTLNIRTETLAYFITEGALQNDLAESTAHDTEVDQKANKLFAEGLGMGPKVPRYLRSDESVQIREMALQELQQQLQDIWRSKLAHEAQHGRCGLQEYLYHHFAAAVSAKGSNQDSSSSSSSSSGSRQGNAVLDKRYAAVEAGYSFYHACCCHRHDSAVVDAVWHVLTGQLPETVVLQQQQQQVTAVLQVIEEVAAAAVGKQVESGDAAPSGQEAVAGVAVTDLSAALRFLYPLKARQDLAELTASLLAVVSSSNNSNTSAGTEGGDNSSSSSVVGCDGLLQAASAIRQAADTSLVVPIVLSEQQQQVYFDSPQAYVVAAAASRLLDTLLRQHLQTLLQHTQQVVQQVGQLLQQPSVSAAVAASAAEQDCAESASQAVTGPVTDVVAMIATAAQPDLQAGSSSSNRASSAATLQELVAYLAQATAAGGSSSSGVRQLQTIGSMSGAVAGESGARILNTAQSSSRKLGSIRYRASGSDAQDMPLVAAAAAAVAQKPVQGQSLSDAVSSNTGVVNSAGLQHWLTAVQLLLAKQHASQDQAGDGDREVQQVLSVEDIVRWLQRECLLQPESCVPDVAAAVQWCRTALAGRTRPGLQMMPEKA